MTFQNMHMEGTKDIRFATASKHWLWLHLGLKEPNGKVRFLVVYGKGCNVCLLLRYCSLHVFSQMSKSTIHNSLSDSELLFFLTDWLAGWLAG